MHRYNRWVLAVEPLRTPTGCVASRTADCTANKPGSSTLSGSSGGTTGGATDAYFCLSGRTAGSAGSTGELSRPVRASLRTGQRHHRWAQRYNRQSANTQASGTTADPGGCIARVYQHSNRQKQDPETSRTKTASTFTWKLRFRRNQFCWIDNNKIYPTTTGNLRN